MNPKDEIERTVRELEELETEAEDLAKQVKHVWARTQEVAHVGVFNQLDIDAMGALHRLAEERNVAPGQLAKTLVLEGLRREGALA